MSSNRRHDNAIRATAPKPTRVSRCQVSKHRCTRPLLSARASGNERCCGLLGDSQHCGVRVAETIIGITDASRAHPEAINPLHTHGWIYYGQSVGTDSAGADRVKVRSCAGADIRATGVFIRRIKSGLDRLTPPRWSTRSRRQSRMPVEGRSPSCSGPLPVRSKRGR